MTYSGLLMWDGSLKIPYIVDFWHFFSWRLWRARNIKKIKTDELGINAPISWTRRIQNISKNQNLYPHQSRITYQPMLWDILDWLNNQHFTTFRKSTKCCAQTISLESSIVKLFNSESNVDYIIFSSRWKDCQVSHLIREKLRWTYGALSQKLFQYKMVTWKALLWVYWRRLALPIRVLEVAL